MKLTMTRKYRPMPYFNRHDLPSAEAKVISVEDLPEDEPFRGARVGFQLKRAIGGETKLSVDMPAKRLVHLAFAAGLATPPAEIESADLLGKRVRVFARVNAKDETVHFTRFTALSGAFGA